MDFDDLYKFNDDPLHNAWLDGEIDAEYNDSFRQSTDGYQSYSLRAGNGFPCVSLSNTDVSQLKLSDVADLKRNASLATCRELCGRLSNELSQLLEKRQNKLLRKSGDLSKWKDGVGLEIRQKIGLWGEVDAHIRYLESNAWQRRIRNKAFRRMLKSVVVASLIVCFVILLKLIF